MADDRNSEETSYMPRSYGRGPGRKPRKRNRSLDNSKRPPLTGTKQAPSDETAETGQPYDHLFESKYTTAQIGASDIDETVAVESLEELESLEPSSRPLVTVQSNSNPIFRPDLCRSFLQF